MHFITEFQNTYLIKIFLLGREQRTSDIKFSRNNLLTRCSNRRKMFSSQRKEEDHYNITTLLIISSLDNTVTTIIGSETHSNVSNNFQSTKSFGTIYFVRIIISRVRVKSGAAHAAAKDISRQI